MVLFVWGDYPPSKARNTFPIFVSNVITKPPILHHCYNKTQVLLYLCVMKVELTETKLRRLVRSVIREQDDNNDYFNVMVDEIDSHYGHILIMKDQVRESIGEFKNMIEEIRDADEITDDEKEILVRKILSVFNEGDIYKI